MPAVVVCTQPTKEPPVSSKNSILATIIAVPTLLAFAKLRSQRVHNNEAPQRTKIWAHMEKAPLLQLPGVTNRPGVMGAMAHANESSIDAAYAACTLTISPIGVAWQPGNRSEAGSLKGSFDLTWSDIQSFDVGGVRSQYVGFLDPGAYITESLFIITLTSGTQLRGEILAGPQAGGDSVAAQRLKAALATYKPARS
jgi:hypothetical protein